jgi:hypothetical protein
MRGGSIVSSPISRCRCFHGHSVSVTCFTTIFDNYTPFGITTSEALSSSATVARDRDIRAVATFSLVPTRLSSYGVILSRDEFRTWRWIMRDSQSGAKRKESRGTKTRKKNVHL